MKLYSTKSPQQFATLKQAVFQSLPPDNGLYMPENFQKLPQSFFDTIQDQSFQDIAFAVARHMIGKSVDETSLRHIVEEAINFPAPVRELEKDIFVLELFHGPTMAFKDFGARFMSRLMNYFLEQEQKEIDILVATSGDTGGAVAQGFYGVEGTRVTILYPKGKVSPLQEKQLTTLGQNITTLEIDGTFDDCQSLVKKAFLDADLNRKKNLSSANSINIARLIPQTFYYFNACAQLKRSGHDKPVVFSVPSGNFGNLTAGLFARKMGLPVHHFVASTNVNDIVPEYLKTGIFKAKPSVHTLSNAMDIGNPSNFERMKYLFNNEVNPMRKQISGFAFDDKKTLEVIRTVETRDNYMLCPHTAIAYQGLKAYLKTEKEKVTGVFLSSAHPCKFPNVFDKEQWQKISIPAQAEEVMKKEKRAITMPADFETFKTWLADS